MKKKITKILSILLVIAMVFSTYTISPKTTKGNTADVKHDFEWDMYEHCSKIENAEKGKEYSLEITKDKPIYVIEYTAVATEKLVFECGYLDYSEEDEFDGYAYFFEGDNEAEGKLSALIDNSVNAHFAAYDIDYIGVETSDWYNGQMPGFEVDVEKNKKYYFVFREYDEYTEQYKFVFRIRCGHKNKIVNNKTLVNCDKGGYSGDVYCKDCGELLRNGQNIEAGAEHYYDMNYIEGTCSSYSKIINTCTVCGYVDEEILGSQGYGDHCYKVEGYVAPTCKKSGQSGTSKCIYCGDINYENHELKAYHEQVDENGHNDNYTYEQNLKTENCMVDGYTGDYACRYCEEVLEKGQKITAPGHSFVDGICEECGIEENLLPIGSDGAYEIASYEDLMLFVENAHHGIKGRLTKDIIISDIDEEASDYNYMEDSVIDGDGYTIKNWDVNESNFLFYQINDSLIENITFEVSGEVGDWNRYGVVARFAEDSTFNNVTVKGKIQNKKAAMDIGAITGRATNSKFISCTNDADIEFVSGNAGGIVGRIMGESLIENCTNNGNITGTALTFRRSGGIVGFSYVNSKKDIKVQIKGCINNGKVAGNEYAGGILGSGIDTLFSDTNVNNGEISGGKYVGNLIGYDGHITYVNGNLDDNEDETTTGDVSNETKKDETSGSISDISKDETTEVNSNKETNLSMSKPGKVKIRSIKNAKGKKIKLTWKKMNNITGYRIRYSVNKKFKKAKIKNVKKGKTQAVITKLKNKKYYVQIRAYRKVAGKTYWGNWSSRKSVKVNK